MKSPRLRQLVTLDSEGGMIPSVFAEELKLFDTFIVWKRVAGQNDEIPEPRPG